MSSAALDILTQQRTAIVDEIVARVLADVPRYALSPTHVLREHCEGLFDDFLSTLSGGTTPEAFRVRIGKIASERIKAGFSAQDFVRAVLLVYPVMRQVLRQLGPKDDPQFSRAFREIEEPMLHLVSAAVNVYSQGMVQKAEQKSTELQRQNEELRMHEQELRRDAAEREKLLVAARELNQRVIDSLSSGVFVTEAPSQIIRFWSPRMEELLGLPAEAVLGKKGTEALKDIKGIPHDEVIQAVRTMGHLPLTKLLVTLPNGRSRHLFLRGEDLRGASPGDPRQGVVFVVDDITERELLIDSFSRFVSREIVNRVLSRAEPSRLEGERRDCTVLFADLRGFTGIAEKMEPEALHELLNQFFRVVIEQISLQGGLIDKFIGDKIMAVFADGGPAEAARSAATAALKMQSHISQVNAERKEKSLAPLDVGIGLNSGTVVMGNVGSEERMNFTVIGDAVNVADRLQSLARGGEIYLGDKTRSLLGEKFKAEDLGEKILRGRVSPERVFKLIG
ncbi:MAG: adenylate/guanylate cyclase domain-containing protein [Myxococcaceae bacterium]